MKQDQTKIYFNVVPCFVSRYHASATKGLRLCGELLATTIPTNPNGFKTANDALAAVKKMVSQ